MKHLLLLALFLGLNGFAVQAQNGQLTVGLQTIPGCGCEGCLILSVSNLTSTFVAQWSDGNVTSGTTTMYCGLCPGQYTVTVTDVGNQQTATATANLPNIPYTPLDIISQNTAPCNSDSITGGNVDCEQVCAGATVSYSVSGIGVPPASGNYTWQVSGASSWVTSPQGTSVTVTWGNAGVGSLQVFTNSVQNCAGQDYLCVTILAPPTAKIASNPAAAPGTTLQVCKGQAVDFQNLSTGDADLYQWYFSDDLSGSTAADPQHTFLNAGTHTVTLVASSYCLCSDTTVMTVEVLDAEAPVLDCVATICSGETVTYTASNACAPFVWNVTANGTILEGGTATADSITVQWNNGPSGNISLLAAACSGATCPTGGLTHIPIISDNAEIRGEESVCPGSMEVYSIEAFGGSGFVWTLSGGGFISDGQGTNRITVNWQNAASTSTTYWLSVQYSNCYLGCGGQDSIPVKVLSGFYVDGPIEVCDNAIASFTSKFSNNNAAISCNWTLNGPNGSIVWTSSSASAAVNAPFTDGDGYYRLFAVPATLGQTCTDQADWAINVKPRPAKLTSIKGAQKICPGTTYTYEAEGGAPASNYFWTVQNGASGPFYFSGQTLNIAWNAGGTHWLSVSQVSSDGLSCLSDTIQLQVNLIGIPDITGNPIVCEDSKGTYLIDALQNVDLQWQITPATAGSVASGQGTNVAEIYWSQAGAHVVNLSVCGQTANFPVAVNANPDPMVQAPGSLCPGATALVQTASTFTTYTWKDHAGAVLANTATITLGAGNFAIEVVDANGCKGAQEFVIGRWENPNVSLTTASPTGFCNNSLFVPLTALTNADGDYTFQWWHDGTLIPGATTSTYTTNQYGYYTVQATNSHGCSSVAGPLQLVLDCTGGGGGCLPCNGIPCPPGTVDLAIDPTARCDSFQMHLLDPNSVYQPGTASWIVGISGNSVLHTSTDDHPSFTFTNAGEYVAILVVQLIDGTVCNVYDFFGAEAVARIRSTPACPGASTDLQDVSEFLPSGGITNWDWNFGDPASGANNISSVRNPSHTYAPSGNYSAMLTVTGTSGCTSSATEIVNIPALPNVAFPEPAFKCAGNALEFVPPPNSADITDLSWDFGDPASGASNDATGSPAYHHFSPAGNYSVTATATNVFGCTASFSRNLTITPNSLSGTISPAIPPAICEGSSITLTAPPGGVSYVWSDDNATTTPFLTVTKEGTYRVTLTDANGCTYAPPAVKVELNAAPDVLIKAFIFNELGQIAGTSYPTLTVCEGEDVNLQAITNGTLNYSWSVTNGNSPFLYYTDDRGNLLTAGNYTYSVTVTNPSTGCTAVSPPFLVTVNPVPSGFSISGSGFCAGDPNAITYSGPQPPNWQLIWNTGLSGPVLSTEEPGVYHIRVINEFGCEAISNPWTILPGPPVNSLPAGCHTRCKPDTLCLPLLPTVIHWQWFQNGSPIPGANTSNFIAQQSGTYWAELTDYFGCTAQSDPLTLDLYDGYGNILGQVWSDVNNNGLIDAGDTLVSGIPILLLENGTLSNAASSGANGAFAFANILSTNYSVEINPATISANWNIVIGQDPVSLSGCDVVGNADLLVHFQCLTASSSLQLNACPGSTATYNGASIPVGSTQLFHFPDGNGCDSVVTVNVAPWPASSGAATLYSCPGGTANYAGTAIPVGTSQNFTLTNWLGCDSIVTVSVQPLPTSTGTATLHACPGGTANYAGTAVPVGTSQNFILTNWLGCDSIVTVSVQPLPTSTGTATLHACPGGTANYAGTAVPVGTSQNFTLTNWLGCDSIVTVNVQPWTTSTGTVTLHACPGSTADYNGTAIATGTTQNFTLTNWLGCDSIVTVNVAAWPTSTGSATLLFACSGGSVMYNGTSIPAGTSQQFTLQTWLGCDSIVTVSVAALPVATGSATLYACPGGTANYAGTDIPVGTSQNFPLQNWLGCDSIVTVNVAAWPISTGATTLFACPGGTANYAGTDIPVGSSQNFPLQNWLGCDSIVTVNVAAWPTSTGATTLYACPGGTANYAGTDIPVGTSQNFPLQNWLGCDSIVTVNVAAWPTSTSATTLYACPGGTANYAGTDIPAGTTQNVSLPNWLGCDSIVAVTVAPWIPMNTSFETGVCPGETFTYQGVALQGGVVQSFVLQNWLGCDSTVTVTVKQLQNSANTVDVNVCPGETYLYNGVQMAGGETQAFHLPNAEGCDSTITVQVHALPATTFAVQAQRACSNAPTGSLEAVIDPGGQAPFQLSLNNIDYQNDTRFDQLNAGDYEVFLEDANGCVFKQQATIPQIPALTLQLPNGIISCDSSAVTLVPMLTGGDTATLALEWWNGSRDSTAIATEAGNIWVEATDVCGTERSEAVVEWAELAKDLNIVYVPNVLKPSSIDPENARFRPLFAAGISLIQMKFMVFDRWGNKLFETKSTADGWDGIFQTRDMNPGVEVWYLEADVAICGRIIHVVKKGDVTVVR